MNSEKKILEENLDRLLAKDSESIVISIKGSWGIGKSFFWHKFSEKFNKKEYAYISLFGQTSIDSIKKDIIYKISSYSNVISKIQEKVGTSKIAGIDVSSIMTSLSKSEFKNIIICFDDFERISKEVDVKDVMGLISELKEQNGCKVLIINNSGQLKQSDEINDIKILKKSNENKVLDTKFYIRQSNNEESFKLFYEKIIDREFLYCPSIEENFLIVSKNIKYFDRDLILNFLEWTNKNDNLFKNFNIRILKRLIYALNIFHFLSNNNISSDIKNSISAYIFEKVYCKKIESYDFEKTNISSIYDDINLAMEKSLVINEDDFLIKINEIQVKSGKNKDSDNIRKLYDRFNFDLSYDNNTFEEDLFDILQKQKNNIIRLVSLDTLSFYISLLSELTPEKKYIYDKFFIESSTLFIDSITDTDESLQKFLNNEIELKFKEYPEIISYIQKKKDNYIKAVKNDINSVIALLDKPNKKGGWSPKDEAFITSISMEEHKKNMKESMDYLQASFNFARWSNSFSGSRPFKTACKNITDAMLSLSEESEEYKVKLKNIINIIDEESIN